MTMGRRYDAAAAVEAGVVHELAAEDEVVARAVALAHAQTARAGPVLGAVKRDLHSQAAASLAAGSLPAPLDD